MQHREGKYKRVKTHEGTRFQQHIMSFRAAENRKNESE